MNSKNLKTDLISIIEPLFGKQFTETINTMYEGDDPQELIELGHKLLVGYLGEAAANKLMEKLLKKYNLKSKLIPAR